jgi:8-oxo-dGTP pyrophosphatase MutT (NUDIX family)
MPQSYKIFINGTPLFLTETGGATLLGLQSAKNLLVAHYTGSKKWLFPYINQLEKTHKHVAIVLEFDDLAKLWLDFQSLFKIIEAAGGYVLNEKKELLVMFRRGSWDLPKGKIDAGETQSEAAVREVQEETGIKNIELGAFLTTTFHVYIHKEKRVLKPTYWFLMHTSDVELTPQTEEDIEQIIWAEPKNWLAGEMNVYPNIREVILRGIDQ